MTITYQSALAQFNADYDANRLAHLTRQADKRQAFLDEVLTMKGVDEASIARATYRRDQAVAKLADFEAILDASSEAPASPCMAGICEVAWHPTKPVGAVADYRANGFHLLSA